MQQGPEHTLRALCAYPGEKASLVQRELSAVRLTEGLTSSNVSGAALPVWQGRSAGVTFSCDEKVTKESPRAFPPRYPLSILAQCRSSPYRR